MHGSPVIWQLMNRDTIHDPFTTIQLYVEVSVQHHYQLSAGQPIHLQWITSHVGLPGNEVADDLAKAATSNPGDPEDRMVLTST
ncbi:hypothetical protein TNCV_4917671 [Trichonephila clavipes]|nr:hypothetical protein TNCV_4917671 [Trichonephila clavipes]